LKGGVVIEATAQDGAYTHLCLIQPGRSPLIRRWRDQAWGRDGMADRQDLWLV